MGQNYVALASGFSISYATLNKLLLRGMFFIETQNSFIYFRCATMYLQTIQGINRTQQFRVKISVKKCADLKIGRKRWLLQNIFNKNKEFVAYAMGSTSM